ncbi:MAG: class I SAM-dependent methyltransferase [Actinomycetes bacterium]
MSGWRGRPALELAIGTSRIALPLAARDIRVDGIELSSAMIARLREKPGGDQLAVTRGDMADVPVDDRYPLIYLVFNTIFNLLTQDAQVRCFENVSRLGDGLHADLGHLDMNRSASTPCVSTARTRRRSSNACRPHSS